MKNSASNSSQIQALQIRAEQLLPVIDHTLTNLNYKEIIHQRMSQQNGDQSNNVQTDIYQGLTRATDSNSDKVMVKWQISAAITNNLSSLNHEIKVLKALNSFKVRAHSPKNITPPLLAYENLPVNILHKVYQLTVLVMPYYALGSLAQQLNDKNYSLLTDSLKQYFIMQAAYLIADLHQQGWLHNDIKPSNFLLNSFMLKSSFLAKSVNNTAKMSSLLLTDFALAERIDESFSIDDKINPAGTPAYLAPERWQGQAPTQQSDIYALGIMIYEILVGKRVFTIAKQTDDPLQAWAMQHCQQSLPLLPTQYRNYQFIINKALAKRTENRYQSMTDIVRDLALLENQ